MGRERLWGGGAIRMRRPRELQGKVARECQERSEREAAGEKSLVSILAGPRVCKEA